MNAFRLVRGPGAFEKPRQKRKRVQSKEHLDFIRGLPCLICGARPVDPAHLRSSPLGKGKRQTGMQEKSNDRWTLPLCRPHHEEQHGENEAEWWDSYGLDPYAIASYLWGTACDDETGLEIIRENSPNGQVVEQG